MKKRRTKAEIERERIANAACQHVLTGTQISMLDIPKLFRECNRLLDDGVRGSSLLTGLRAFLWNLNHPGEAPVVFTPGEQEKA